jgi:DNA-binding LacI/PurR family transcriptional regulator
VLTARSATDGEQVVGQFLAAPTLPTALMVESDELAMSVMAACWRMGLRTPEDVSVIGFDDHAMAGTFGLSTIAQPVDVLGREAAALALSLVTVAAEEHQPATAPPSVTVPTRLVLRSSTARARSTRTDAATNS